MSNARNSPSFSLKVTYPKPLQEEINKNEGQRKHLSTMIAANVSLTGLNKKVLLLHDIHFNQGLQQKYIALVQLSHMSQVQPEPQVGP